MTIWKKKIPEKTEFLPSNSKLQLGITASKANRTRYRFGTSKFTDLAWQSLEELDRLIGVCESTKFQEEYMRVLSLFRIAQGIRADLLESILLIEKAHYSSVAPILRSCIENASVMIGVTQKDRFFIQLDEDDLNLPKCVGEASKVFADAGRRYGLLTKIGVHQEKSTLGANLLPRIFKSHNLVQIPNHTNFNSTIAPLLTENIVYICYMTCFTLELAFAHRLKNKIFIERTSDSQNWKTADNSPSMDLLNKHNFLFQIYKPLMRLLFWKWKITNQ